MFIYKRITGWLATVSFDDIIHLINFHVYLYMSEKREKEIEVREREAEARVATHTEETSLKVVTAHKVKMQDFKNYIRAFSVCMHIT